MIPAVLASFALLAIARGAFAVVQFDDVSAQAGIDYTGESYGVSWGDLNGDGWPDLFVNHHRFTPGLLVNLGNRTFEDRWQEVERWRKLVRSNGQHGADQHGGAWVDYDNDGDQDLWVALGMRDQQQFLVNNGKFLEDKTVQFGFAPTRWEAWMPAWFDFTQDGFLDFGMAVGGAAPQIFAQVPGATMDKRFVVKNFATGQKCKDIRTFQLADLDSDGAADLICDNQQLYPNKIYDFHTLPFQDITPILPPVANVPDAIVADFDRNLHTDILLIGGGLRLNGAAIAGPYRAGVQGIQAYFQANGIKERGFNFVTSGNLSFSLAWSEHNTTKIHIGASGYSLAPQPGTELLVWNLSATDPRNVGIQPHNPATDQGMYIGLDPATKRWTVLVSPGNSRNVTYWYVDSTAPISSLKDLGVPSFDRPVASTLYLNRGGVFTDEAARAGLSTPRSCVSGVAGDFDNDMDMDLYFVCRGAIGNLANQYYANNGNGTFALVADSGAEGPVGIGTGLGESVAMADYDLNGFLDLYVTNGLSMFPEDDFNVGGPDKLFRNRGNANHWVELDLVGTLANRDAIGAKVYVKAGGVTQLREQNGGYHRWSQNHQRIHAGLGTNTTVSLEIHWPSPSTRIDTIPNLPADKLYRIAEGGRVDQVVPPRTVAPSPCLAPTFNKATESGMFLWKDCSTGIWSLRASPGGQPLTYRGSISGNQAFGSVTAVSLEAVDILDFTTNPRQIGYTLKVNAAALDGFDFTYPAGSPTCLRLELPAGAPVYVGPNRTPLSPPFDLNTMRACTATP